jgi:hypothetical protein
MDKTKRPPDGPQDEQIETGYRERPLGQKRELQPTVDRQVKVEGKGRFKPRGSFEWYPIPKEGAWLLPGSLVHMDTGRGGSIDGFPIQGSSTGEIPLRARTKKEHPNLDWTPDD